MNLSTISSWWIFWRLTLICVDTNANIYIYTHTSSPNDPSFDWKLELLLVAKQRTNGFQVYTHAAYICKYKGYTLPYIQYLCIFIIFWKNHPGSLGITYIVLQLHPLSNPHEVRWENSPRRRVVLLRHRIQRAPVGHWSREFGTNTWEWKGGCVHRAPIQFLNPKNPGMSQPITSMYGVFTYIYHTFPLKWDFEKHHLRGKHL